MIQMHDHRGHSQTLYWVEPRVGFLALGREVWCNLLSDVLIPVKIFTQFRYCLLF
jgi:hypothetical protein